MANGNVSHPQALFLELDDILRNYVGYDSYGDVEPSSGASGRSPENGKCEELLEETKEMGYSFTGAEEFFDGVANCVPEKPDPSNNNKGQGFVHDSYTSALPSAETSSHSSENGKGERLQDMMKFIDDSIAAAEVLCEGAASCVSERPNTSAIGGTGGTSRLAQGQEVHSTEGTVQKQLACNNVEGQTDMTDACLEQGHPHLNREELHIAQVQEECNSVSNGSKEIPCLVSHSSNLSGNGRPVGRPQKETTDEFTSAHSVESTECNVCDQREDSLMVRKNPVSTCTLPSHDIPVQIPVGKYRTSCHTQGTLEKDDTDINEMLLSTSDEMTCEQPEGREATPNELLDNALGLANKSVMGPHQPTDLPKPPVHVVTKRPVGRPRKGRRSQQKVPGKSGMEELRKEIKPIRYPDNPDDDIVQAIASGMVRSTTDTTTDVQSQAQETTNRVLQDDSLGTVCGNLIVSQQTTELSKPPLRMVIKRPIARPRKHRGSHQKGPGKRKMKEGRKDIQQRRQPENPDDHTMHPTDDGMVPSTSDEMTCQHPDGYEATTSVLRDDALNTASGNLKSRIVVGVKSAVDEPKKSDMSQQQQPGKSGMERLRKEIELTRHPANPDDDSVHYIDNEMPSSITDQKPQGQEATDRVLQDDSLGMAGGNLMVSQSPTHLSKPPLRIIIKRPVGRPRKRRRSHKKEPGQTKIKGRRTGIQLTGHPENPDECTEQPNDDGVLPSASDEMTFQHCDGNEATNSVIREDALNMASGNMMPSQQPNQSPKNVHVKRPVGRPKKKRRSQQKEHGKSCCEELKNNKEPIHPGNPVVQSIDNGMMPSVTSTDLQDDAFDISKEKLMVPQISKTSLCVTKRPVGRPRKGRSLPKKLGKKEKEDHLSNQDCSSKYGTNQTKHKNVNLKVPIICLKKIPKNLMNCTLKLNEDNQHGDGPRRSGDTVLLVTDGKNSLRTHSHQPPSKITGQSSLKSGGSFLKVHGTTKSLHAVIWPPSKKNSFEKIGQTDVEAGNRIVSLNIGQKKTDVSQEKDNEVPCKPFTWVCPPTAPKHAMHITPSSEMPASVDKEKCHGHLNKESVMSENPGRKRGRPAKKAVMAGMKSSKESGTRDPLFKGPSGFVHVVEPTSRSQKCAQNCLLKRKRGRPLKVTETPKRKRSEEERPNIKPNMEPSTAVHTLQDGSQPTEPLSSQNSARNGQLKQKRGRQHKQERNKTENYLNSSDDVHAKGDLIGTHSTIHQTFLQKRKMGRPPKLQSSSNRKSLANNRGVVHCFTGGHINIANNHESTKAGQKKRGRRRKRFKLSIQKKKRTVSKFELSKQQKIDTSLIKEKQRHFTSVSAKLSNPSKCLVVTQAKTQQPKNAFTVDEIAHVDSMVNKPFATAKKPGRPRKITKVSTTVESLSSGLLVGSLGDDSRSNGNTGILENLRLSAVDSVQVGRPCANHVPKVPQVRKRRGRPPKKKPNVPTKRQTKRGRSRKHTPQESYPKYPTVPLPITDHVMFGNFALHGPQIGNNSFTEDRASGSGLFMSCDEEPFLPDNGTHNIVETTALEYTAKESSEAVPGVTVGESGGPLVMENLLDGDICKIPDENQPMEMQQGSSSRADCDLMSDSVLAIPSVISDVRLDSTPTHQLSYLHGYHSVPLMKEAQFCLPLT